MHGLSISCLGPFELKVDNQIIGLEQWKSKKAFTLLQYLITMQGDKVSLDSIVQVLWPDSTVDMSMDNLYTTVYNLRQTLDPTKKRAHNWIRNSNRLYWLDVSQIAFLDIIEFEKKIELGKQLESTEPLKALDTFQQALKLYRGQFLMELDNVSWTNQPRLYYQRNYLHTVFRTCRILVEHCNDYPRAVAILKDAIDKEPYQEFLYKLLIEYLLALGASGEAIKEYETYAYMLEKNFGLAPDKELQQKIYKTRLSSGILEVDDGDGAFYCEPDTFKKIVNLEQRRIARSKEQLILLTLETGFELAMEVARVISNLFRRSDVLCRYPDRLVLLLSISSDAQVDKIINRIDSVLLSELHMTLPIDCQIIKEEQKEPQNV